MTEIAFLNQIEQYDTAIDVVLGNRHNQPEIVFDHLLACRKISLFGQCRKVNFLLNTEQRPQTDLVQVALGRIGGQLRGEQ
jgi:hypothetical protein